MTDPQPLEQTDMGDVINDADAGMGQVLEFPEQPTAADGITEHAEAGTDIEVRPASAPVLYRGRELARRGAKTLPVAWSGTKTALTSAPVRHTVRHAYYVGGGMKDVANGAYKRVTNGHIEDQIRAAQAAGEHAIAAELRKQKAATDSVVVKFAKAIGWLVTHPKESAASLALLVTVFPLLVTVFAIVAQTQPGGLDFGSTWQLVIDGVAAGAQWAGWLAGMLPYAAGALVFGALANAYAQRVKRGVAPDSLQPVATGGEQVIPFSTDNLIRALADLEIAKLSAAIKDGWPNREGEFPWFKAPRQDGPGMTASIRLPGGVEVEKVEKKRATFAHNLGCVPAEMLLTRNSTDSTVLDIYRLDKGELRRPAPKYPLLHEDTADFFKGVPVGVTPFGKTITAHLFERNYVVSGAMGSGKTVLIQDILAGASLDPIVDLEVICFAANADYSGMDPVLDRRLQGDPMEVAAQAEERFEELQADLVRRGELFEKLGPGTTLTRELATKYPELRPRIVVLDECQWFFRQDKPEDRRRVVNAVLNYITTARKYGVVLMLATPVPSDQSLPRDIVSVTTNNACGAINDKRRNNVVLGDNAHENGISALGLVPRNPETGELNDTGTLITVGFTAATSETLRTHYLDQSDMATVVERATALRGGPVQRDAQADTDEDRDLLEDLGQVLGSEAVSPADVVSLLRDLAPKWKPYRDMTGKDLQATLASKYGYKVPTTNNRPRVQPEKIAELRARQTTTDPDGQDDLSAMAS